MYDFYKKNPKGILQADNLTSGSKFDLLRPDSSNIREDHHAGNAIDGNILTYFAL